MGNRFLQAMRTQLRPRNLMFWGMFLNYLFIVTMARDNNGNFSQRYMKLLCVGWPAFCIAAHLKGQFAQPQSRLMPHFALPHLVAAASMMCLSVSMLIFLLVMHSHYSTPATTAAVLSGFVLSLWLDLFHERVLLVLMGIVMVVLFFEPPRMTAITEFLHNDSLPVTLCLIVGSVALLIWLAARLMRLDEDDPSYCVEPNQWNWNKPGGGLHRNADHPSAIGGWSLRCARDAMLDRVLSRQGVTPQDLSLWRIPTALPGIGLCFKVAVGALPIWAVWTLLHRSAAVGEYANYRYGSFITVVCLCMLAMLPLNIWVRRSSSLGHEFTRPLTRERIVRRLGMAIAVDFLTIGAALWVVATIAGSPEGPVPYADSQWWAITAVFAGITVLCYGIYAILSTMRSKSTFYWIVVVNGFVGMVFFATSLSFHLLVEERPYFTMCVSGLVALLGCWIMFEAYRRWLTTDIE